MSVQVKSSGSSPTLQSRTVTPSSSTQYITAQTGYDALNQVTVYGDSNLIGSNIKGGVSIFGVSGSYTGDVRESISTGGEFVENRTKLRVYFSTNLEWIIRICSNSLFTMIQYDGGGVSFFFFSSSDNDVVNNTKWYCNELFFNTYAQNDGILTTTNLTHQGNYIEFKLHNGKTPYTNFDANFVKDKFYILWRPYQY